MVGLMHPYATRDLRRKIIYRLMGWQSACVLIRDSGIANHFSGTKICLGDSQQLL